MLWVLIWITRFSRGKTKRQISIHGVGGGGGGAWGQGGGGGVRESGDAFSQEAK